MSRWVGVIALLCLLPAAAARAQDDAEAPAAPAENAGPAAAQPAAPELSRFAAPVLGHPVAARVEMGALAFRDVTLLRQRGPKGELLLGARVRLANTGEAPLAPAFRLFLYRGQDPVGTLVFPAPGDEAKGIVAGSTYTWTGYLAADGKPLPDAFAIAPPEPPKESVGDGDAATPGLPAASLATGGTVGGAGKAALGGAAGPGAKQKGMGTGGAAKGTAGRAGAGMGNARQKLGGGLPNNILKAPGMRAGGIRKPKLGGGLNTKGMRKNVFTAPGMRQTPLKTPGMRQAPGAKAGKGR